MAKLFDTASQNITMHTKKVYEDEELDEISTCKIIVFELNLWRRKRSRNAKKRLQYIHWKRFSSSKSGTEGFEPPRWLDQNQLPYHLATSHRTYYDMISRFIVKRKIKRCRNKIKHTNSKSKYKFIVYHAIKKSHFIKNNFYKSFTPEISIIIGFITFCIKCYIGFCLKASYISVFNKSINFVCERVTLAQQ